MTPSDPESVEDAPAEPKAVVLGRQSLPDRQLYLTAKRALLPQATKPIVAAFLHAESLRGTVRKLTREQWQDELDRFQKAPR